jgi:hypothetical protein
MVAALCTTPVNQLVDFLFNEVLSAPTARDNGDKKTSPFPHVLEHDSTRLEIAPGIHQRHLSGVKKNKLNLRGRTRTLSKAFSRKSLVVDTTRVVPQRVSEAQASLNESIDRITKTATAQQHELAKLSRRYSENRTKLRHSLSHKMGGTMGSKAPSIRHISTELNAQSMNGVSREGELSNAEKGESGMTKLSIDDVFLELMLDLHHQRQRLLDKNDKKEQKKLESLWGVAINGDFVKKRKLASHFSPNSLSDAAGIIKKELQLVRDHTNAKVKELRSLHDALKGTAILHLFIIDLLGRDTPHAIMFGSKTDEDYRRSLVVTPFFHAIAWTMVLFLNCFFVFFSILKAHLKGVEWQRTYVMSCIIQMVIEVVFYETSECILTHYVFPDLAWSDVRSVGVALQQAIETVCSSTVPTSAPLLDAPKYLFVSTNVALEFPDLVESMVVRAYHSSSPGPLSLKWRSKGNQARVITLTTLMIAILTIFTPQQQKMLIHILQPLVISGLGFVFVFLRSHPILFVVPGLLLLAAGLYLYRTVRHHSITTTESEGEIRLPPLLPSSPPKDSCLLDIDGDVDEEEESPCKVSLNNSYSGDQFLRQAEYVERKEMLLQNGLGAYSRNDHEISATSYEIANGEGIVWHSSASEETNYQDWERDGESVSMSYVGGMEWPPSISNEDVSMSEMSFVWSSSSSGNDPDILRFFLSVGPVPLSSSSLSPSPPSIKMQDSHNLMLTLPYGSETERYNAHEATIELALKWSNSSDSSSSPHCSSGNSEVRVSRDETSDEERGLTDGFTADRAENSSCSS